MDSPFAKEYAAQTGIIPNSQTVDTNAVQNVAQSSPFAQEYQAQTGVSIPSTPSDVTNASQLGSSPTSSKYNGYCQQFVDDVLNTPAQNRAPTALDAWSSYAQNGRARQGTKGIEPGDLIYFSDPNDPAGHVGIFSGNNKFISATEENPNQPVQNHSISAWQDLTGQQVLGYVKNPENLPKIGGQK